MKGSNNDLRSIKLSSDTLAIGNILKAKFNKKSLNDVVYDCLNYFVINDVNPKDITGTIESLIVKSGIENTKEVKEHFTKFFRQQEVHMLKPFIKMVEHNFSIIRGLDEDNGTILPGKKVNESVEKNDESIEKSNSFNYDLARQLIEELDSIKKVKNVNGENLFTFEMQLYNNRMDKLKNLVR